MPTGRFVALAATLGVATSVVLTWPLAAHPASIVLDDRTFDAFQFVWNLWWVRESLLELHTHPFFTRLLFYPEGVPLLFHTGAFSLGLATLPLQLLLPGGTVTAHNVLVLAAPGLMLVATAALARTVTGDAWAALVAGIVAAVNAAAVWFLPVLYLDCAWMLPLLVLGWWRVQRDRRPGDVVVLFAALPFAVFASQELAMIGLALLATDTLVRALAAERLAVPPVWWRGTLAFWALAALALGALAAVALASPAAAPPAGQVHVGSGHLLGFVTPPWLRPPRLPFLRVFYLGTLGLVLLVPGVVLGGRRAGLWLALLVITLAMVLGPYVHVRPAIESLPTPTATEPTSGLPGPYLVGLRVFPLLKFFRAPFRWMAGAHLAVAVLVAFAAAGIRARLARRPGWRAAATGGLLVLAVAGAATDVRGLRAPAIRAQVPPAYAVIRDAATRGAVLDVPAGYVHGGFAPLASRYMFHQTFHRRPILEGTVARLPRGRRLVWQRRFVDFAALPWLEWIVVHRDLMPLAGGPQQRHATAVEALARRQGTLVREDATTAVYRLSTFRPETVVPLAP